MSVPPDPALRSSLLTQPPCTRTADRSLCVTLTPPSGRVCNLDCLYCPFPRAEHRDHWPRPGTLEAVLRIAVRDADVDSITVSGPGEPTLHPRFGQALAAVLSARQVRPALRVRIVTNTIRVLHPTVRRLIGFADERIVRMDADAVRIEGAEPALEELREALAELSDFSVESVFVGGEKGNLGGPEVDAWLERIVEIEPDRVYLTTLRDAPEVPGLLRAAVVDLDSIAGRLRKRCPAPVVVLP